MTSTVPHPQAQALPVLKELKCPHCGSPIQQYLPSAQTLICRTCGSHIGVTADGLGILGPGTRLPSSPVPITLGMKATFQGTSFVVLGRVLYEGHDPEDSSDRWLWNEWLLGGTDGRLLWLEYDAEDGYVLSAKIRLREAFDVNAATAIPLGNGRKARVRERYPARIVGAEGELTWQARCGDELTVIDAAGEGKRYSVEADAQEIELYEGDALSPGEVATAFDHQEWIKAIQAHQSSRKALVLAGFLCLLFALIGAVLGVLANGSGVLLTSQTLNLTSTNITSTFALNVESAGHPLLIKAQIANPMPVNTAADLDVTVIAPDQTETVALEHEFFHEAGVDTGYEDGEYYSEDYTDTDYAAESSFNPAQTGSHDMEVAWTPGAGISDLYVKVEVYRDHANPTLFWVYAVVAGIAGLALLLVGSRHVSPNLAPKPAR